MDDRKQYEPLFPKEFDYLNKKYEKFQQALASIDYQLENTLEDRGPNPAPAPDGMRITDPELRLRRNEYLKRIREKVVSGFRNGVQKDIDSFEEKQRVLINSRFDFETARYGFKDYSKSDLKNVKKFSKEDKVSFDYMAANYFNKYQKPEKSIADEKENINAWSEQYFDLLDNYSNRISEFKLELDKDDIDLDLD